MLQCGSVCCSVLQCVTLCCRLHSPSLRRPKTSLHLHNPHANGVLSSVHLMSVKPFSEHQYLLHTCGRRVILSRMVVAACGSIGEIAIAQGLLCFHLGCTCTENTAPRRCPCLVSASLEWRTVAYLVTGRGMDPNMVAMLSRTRTSTGHPFGVHNSLCSSVGQSEGLLIPRSSVRARSQAKIFCGFLEFWATFSASAFIEFIN